MKDEFIIINKTAIQKRIEELEKESKEIEQDESMNTLFVHISGQSSALRNVLSQSTPLIPEIEKAFDAGGINMHNKAIKHNWKGIYQNVNKELFKKTKQDYISNLKLDI